MTGEDSNPTKDLDRRVALLDPRHHRLSCMRWRLTAALVVIPALLLACRRSEREPIPAAPPKAQTATRSGPIRVISLRLGPGDEAGHEIAVGESQAYEFDLVSRRYLSFTYRQIGV